MVPHTVPTPVPRPRVSHAMLEKVEREAQRRIDTDVSGWSFARQLDAVLADIQQDADTDTNDD